MQAFMLVSLAFAILAVVFALQNTGQTTLNFLSWKFEGSLALVILCAAAAGALMSFFASLPSLLRLKWLLRTSRKRLAELESIPETPKPGPR